MNYSESSLIAALEISGIQPPTNHQTTVGLHIMSIRAAFEKFRKDTAKEGFVARLAEYSISYGLLPESYKGHKNVIAVDFKHIEMAKMRDEMLYKKKGYNIGEYGIFIVDIDTQEIIETRYFE